MEELTLICSGSASCISLNHTICLRATYRGQVTIIQSTHSKERLTLGRSRKVVFWSNAMWMKHSQAEIQIVQPFKKCVETHDEASLMPLWFTSLTALLGIEQNHSLSNHYCEMIMGLRCFRYQNRPKIAMGLWVL